MKQLAGVVLAKMQNASKKAALHPVTNVHAIKMREEREFYQKWLVAKFQGICESKGWEMPPVAALQLSDQDLQRADHLKSHRMSRAQTFAGDSPAERVVENLPEVSQSARFGTEITDSMSELSNETGKNSIWNNNPISTYLRETELKVQRRKEEEIAVVRRLAAKRLQPKELPSAQRARLAELRKARGRRLDSSTCTQLSVVDEQLEGASKWHWFARQLYSHEPRTRVVVVLSLLCILSIMLHPEFLLRYLPVEFGPRAPRRLQIVEDICVVIYIFVCAVPFFLLCDVALVYAFGALDLGSKAGRQLKTYYSENVRLGVGVGCLGIVGASVLKAVLRVWVRGILWFASRVYTFLRIEVLARLWSLLIGLLLQVIPEEIRSTCITYVSTLTKLTTHVISTSVWAAVVSVKLIWHILFQSNFVGNEVGRVLWACMAGLSSIARRASDFFEESIEVVEGKATVVAWRTEAFHTARSLFLHTAVFLLSALFLFNLSARKSRPASTFVIESKSSSTQQGANEPMKSNVSSMSGTSASFGPNQSPALQHSRTERNAAISEDAVLDGTDALRMPITHESSEGSRRRRFRLRDKRSFTSTSSLSVVSKQPTKLEYAVSC